MKPEDQRSVAGLRAAAERLLLASRATKATVDRVVEPVITSSYGDGEVACVELEARWIEADGVLAELVAAAEMLEHALADGAARAPAFVDVGVEELQAHP